MVLAHALHRQGIGKEVLVTGGGDGVIKLWSLESLETTGLTAFHKFKNASASVLSLAYDGIFLYAGLAGGRVNVYSLDSQQLVQKINVGSDDVTALEVIAGIAFCGTSNG